MAKIINLRQARKAKKRKAAESTASANRARFGQTMAQRSMRTAEDERIARLLDGARLDQD